MFWMFWKISVLYVFYNQLTISIIHIVHTFNFRGRTYAFTLTITHLSITQQTFSTLHCSWRSSRCITNVISATILFMEVPPQDHQAPLKRHHVPCGSKPAPHGTKRQVKRATWCAIWTTWCIQQQPIAKSAQDGILGRNYVFSGNVALVRNDLIFWN